MPRNANPWTKFHHADYLTDMQRRRCTLATRGFWMEALACFFADETDRFNGPPEELAAMVGCSTEEAMAAVDELLKKDVCDGEITLDDYGCPSNVLIVSRRISRDVTKRESERKRKADYRSSQVSQECPSNVPLSSSVSDSGSSSGDRGSGGKGKGRRSVEYSPEFEAFWSLVQKRVGKAAASAEWNALDPDESLQIVMCDAMREQTRWREIDAEFNPERPVMPPWKDPERWIKYRRWEDEMPPEIRKLEEELNAPSDWDKIPTIQVNGAEAQHDEARRM